MSASAHAWLDQRGSSFPMLANDWRFGSYLAAARVTASHDDPGLYRIRSARLEYVHESAHLGDASFETRAPVVFSRETLRLTLSEELTHRARVYAGVGTLVHAIPQARGFEAQAGLELYGGARDLLHRPLRPYAAYDGTYRRETGGSWDQSVEFGQFHRERHERWAFGFFLDP
jgi:hypothetical protein